MAVHGLLRPSAISKERIYAHNSEGSAILINVLFQLEIERRLLSFALLPNSVKLVHDYCHLIDSFADVFDKSGGIKQTTSSDGEGVKSKVEGPLLERLALKGLRLLKICIGMIASDYPKVDSLKA